MKYTLYYFTKIMQRSYALSEYRYVMSGLQRNDQLRDITDM